MRGNTKHVSVRDSSASTAVGITIALALAACDPSAIGRLIGAAGGTPLPPISTDRAASAAPTPDGWAFPVGPVATSTVTPGSSGASGSINARIEFDR